MTNRKFYLVTLMMIAVGAILGGIFGRMPISTTASNEVSADRIKTDYQQAIELFDKNYVGKVDYEQVSNDSVQAMLWTLDPHSSFFSRDEFRKLDEEQSSQYFGIGVSILQHRDGVYVQSVMPNTPADKAGLRYGDRFVEVEGKNAKEWSSAEVSRNVRGEKGTPVKISVDRVGSQKPIALEIVRGGVPYPSIRNYFMLPDSVGYIGLTGGFQQTTYDELREAVSDLKKQGMKSLVLDLRGNPGGILEQAIKVVSEFIPGGKTVVSVKASRSDSMRELRSNDSDFESFPLAVVINGGSASASEIVAGAIQDYGRGIIVGTDSFGKGLVQRVFRLPYGTGLTLTTARYYTPFGRSLQRDYSSGSIYDYYSHLADTPDEDLPNGAPKPAGSPVVVPDGRTLYGGRGIEPDIRISPNSFDQLRARINEAVFFFVRDLVGGKVAGFESYKNEKQSFRQTVAQGDLQINDRLFDAFSAFASSDKAYGLSTENIKGQAEYSRMRLRGELATANYSSEAGLQILLETDPQIKKAVEVMPQAGRMAEMAAVLKR